MPPRRTRAASSSSRLFDGSSEAGGPLDNVPAQSIHNAVGRGMSPGPGKYSTAYGSPPTILPTRQNVARQRYSFTSALSHVVDAVEKDNANDARERVEREAEQQRRRGEAAATEAGQAADARGTTPGHQSEESLESVELVKEPGVNRNEVTLGHSGRNRSQRQSRASSEQPQPVSATRATRTRQTSEPPATSPTKNFAEEDSIFADAQIFTPNVPSRTAAASRSNILQSLLSSARRFSTIREEPDEETVRQAYPQLNFIQPRADDRPPQTNESSKPHPDPATTRRSTRASDRSDSRLTEKESAPAEADPAPNASTLASSSARAGAKSVKSRIATPGPGARTRKSLFKGTRDSAADELAINHNEPELPVSARNILGRRRSAQSQAQPAALPQQGAESLEAETEKSPPRKIEKTSRPRNSIWGFVQAVGELTRAFAMTITLIVLGLLAIRVFVISTSPDELYEGYRVDNRLHWYGRDWRSNLRQLVPFALVHPLGAISDEEFARVNGLILSHANEVAQMKHAQRLQKDALDKIGRILPAMVHMELDKRGRPVISQEFWHALKDNIEADKDIFTLIWRKDGSMAISDLQWTALKRQLEASGMLADPKAKALSVRDVEDIAETTLSKSWESWLRKNSNKIKDMLGVAKDDYSPIRQPDYGDLVEQLSDDQLAKLARQMTSSQKAKEVIVPKQDFLQILQNSFVEHRLEIKGELAELEERVIDIARTAASAVSSIKASQPSGSASPGPSNGMTKREITALVDQLVRKSITDAQLEAMARGKIAANWNTNLVNQVNFFSRNTGAMFNHHFSSPAYMPYKPPLWKLYRGDAGLGESSAVVRPAPGSLRGSVAFEQWEQDGDCWCAATQGSSKGNNKGDSSGRSNKGSADIAVKLGLRVLPQYLVVEHISPSATLDPGAMPKDLEMWAQITDYALQRPLQDWSLSQFPDTDDRSPLFGWGFVKVGAFTFDANKAASGGGGAQVFKLSSELEALEAVTDHVIIRALTNYGDKDHTCFYRVRLYGQPRLDVA